MTCRRQISASVRFRFAIPELRTNERAFADQDSARLRWCTRFGPEHRVHDGLQAVAASPTRCLSGRFQAVTVFAQLP